jgi:hypothetical protein
MFASIKALIHQWTAPKATESTALVPVPRGTWLQKNVGGVRTYIHRTPVGEQPYTIDEIYDTRKCSLLRWLDALSADGSIKADLHQRLAILQLVPVAPQHHQPKAILTDTVFPSSEVQWTGSQQASGVEWR